MTKGAVISVAEIIVVSGKERLITLEHDEAPAGRASDVNRIPTASTAQNAR
jgi:hypothetical protein